MLNVYYGKMPEAVFNTAVYFKNAYEDEWITDSVARDMILDIDKSIVLDSAVIDSPVMGKIPPLALSGGVKTLILMKNERTKIFNASACGDNCAKWIAEIGRQKNLTINLHHVMDFSAVPAFEAVMLNTGATVHSYGEYLEAAIQIKER